MLGSLLLLEGVFILFAGLVSLLYPEESGSKAIFISALVALCIGGAFNFFNRNSPKIIGKREGYLVVTLVWVVFSLFGSLPFWLSGFTDSYTDAFFEAMSGFTTTGASVFTDIESLPHGLLLWRSMTHFFGGIGILFLLIAILPVYGSGNMLLYQMESSGALHGEKLIARTQDLAKRILLIYISLNVLLIIILSLLGMPFFDSVCHGFGTIATGGFSTKNTNISLYSPFIQYAIVLFSLIGGTNFTLIFMAFTRKFKKIFHDDEFRIYLSVAVISIIIVFYLFFRSGTPLEESLRSSVFHVSSIITSTGYTIDGNINNWPPMVILIMTLLMLTGACAGSTSGGFKFVRVLLLWRIIPAQIKKILHPRGVYAIRLNGANIKEEMLFKVLAFAVFYFVIIISGTIFLMALNVDIATAISGTISCLGNTGVGFGEVSGSFTILPDTGKWGCSFMMLIGRLELFSVLVLFTKGFWSSN